MPIVAIQGCNLSDQLPTMNVHQGDCVNLRSDEGTFQVIGIDGQHDRCWVRRWPIEPKGGSPVFEIPLTQIDVISC